MKDLKIKNNVSLLIFAILILLVFIHSKRSRKALPVFFLTFGIVIYTFLQLYFFISNDKKVTSYMFLSQIIFNAIILVVIIILTSPRSYKDNFSIENPVNIVESPTDPGELERPSRQIFELSPIKKCCGGSYMRTSNPKLDEFCSQFSSSEIINNCVARKNQYEEPHTCDKKDGCYGKKDRISYSIIGVS